LEHKTLECGTCTQNSKQQSSLKTAAEPKDMVTITKKHLSCTPHQPKLSKAEMERRLLGSSCDTSNCFNWRGAPLRNGDNGLFQAGHHSFPLVGQMIELLDQDFVPKFKKQFIGMKGWKSSSQMALVRVCRFVEETDAQRLPAGYCFRLPYGMKEVAETSFVEFLLIAS
jgi:hypothetical protein